VELVVLCVAVSVLGWVLVSRWLNQASVTAPIALVLAGGFCAWVLDFQPNIGNGSEGLRGLAEFALAFVLFADASRVSASWLRDEGMLPGRLLLIGLPLTLGLGVLAAVWLFPGSNLWVLAVIGAALAPTDAALGASVLSDRRVPERVRRILNVESGLNDGLITPFVLFFLAAATAEEDQHSVSAAVESAVLEIAVGVLVGLVLGALAARALRALDRRRWIDRSVLQLGVFTLPLIAYAGTVAVNGNGFVAAFVAGLAYGNSRRDLAGTALDFEEDAGAVLSLAVWFFFGAVALPALGGGELVPALAYGLLSLTVVRVVPVLLALLGSGLRRRDRWVIAWLGPRGLASVVFGLLAADALGKQDGLIVLRVVGATVLLSVFLHGLTARPIAAGYGVAPAEAEGEHALPVRRPIPWQRFLPSRMR
jgi:NhaP-type Na+/H+ or K+/H+ antiporter